MVDGCFDTAGHTFKGCILVSQDITALLLFDDLGMIGSRKCRCRLLTVGILTSVESRNFQCGSTTDNASRKLTAS